MLRFGILIVLTSFISSFCAAQSQSAVLSNGAVAEKVYIQTDGSVYTTDQTIWFKAIVVNAANHRVTSLSGVVYLELVGEDELIKSRKIVKIERGVGNGFLELDPSYTTGRYQLRAYTHWNKNFENRFLFQKYIEVYKSTKPSQAEVYTSITLVENDGGTLLQADLKLHQLDSLAENPTLVFDFGNSRDSLEITVAQDGSYFLNYALPDEANLVSMHLLDAVGQRYSKTILVNPDVLDLQFFPESGKLLDGQVSKVGFKAIAANGLGKFVAGEIVDESDRFVTSFKSNKLGMGHFTMLASKSHRYFARVKSELDTTTWVKYELPSVEEKGTIMSVIKRDEAYLLTVSSNQLKNDSLFVTASMRGARYVSVGGKVTDEGYLRFKIPSEIFREGIVAFTLRDHSGQMVLERFAFNQTGRKHLNITIATDKDDYVQREKSEVTTQVTDSNGNPVSASLSYLVINKKEMGALQESHQNLRSYLLFSSDLKGNIENPGYYFRPEIDRSEDLDALLLTQGWRNYKYQYDIPLANRFQPEYNLTVSGIVSAPLSKKKKKSGVGITMMSFGSESNSYTNTSDSSGRFYFDVSDEYGERMNVLIQTANARGKNKNYQLQLNENTPPKVEFDRLKPLGAADSVVRVLVEKHQQRKLLEDVYRPESYARDLGEVVVEDYALTPERKKVTSVHGMPDVVISGEELQAERKKYSHGLFSVLYWSFPELIELRKLFIDGRLFKIAHVRGSGFTMVTIDGVPVERRDYFLIPAIPVSEIKSFEIIRSPSNFGRLYYEVFSRNSILPSEPAILAIYTHAKKGLFGSKMVPGVIKAAVQVFSPPREFYQPKYAKISNQDWLRPDRRALIHWQPMATANQSGISKTSFYNADTIGEIMVVVEAMAEDGSIGYQEHSYEVKKNKERN